MSSKIAQEVQDLINEYSAISTMHIKDGQAFLGFPMYYSASSIFYIGASSSPVKEFADKHDLPEIMGNYKKPEGLIFGEMQDYIVMLDDSLGRNNISKQEYKNRIERLWDCLVELNPELKTINTEEPASLQKKRAAIIGVDDGYNLTDLDFFNSNLVEMRHSFNANGTRKMNRGVYSISDEYDVLVNYVQDEVGKTSWRPSEQTLTYIKEKHLGRNPKPDNMHKVRKRQKSFIRQLGSKLGF